MLAEGRSVALYSSFTFAQMDLYSYLAHWAECGVVDFNYSTHGCSLIAVQPLFDGAAHGAWHPGFVHDLLPFDCGAASPCAFKSVYPELPVFRVSEEAVSVQKRLCPLRVAECTHHRNQRTGIAGVDVNPTTIATLVEAGDYRVWPGIVRAFREHDYLRAHSAKHCVVEGQIDALAFAGGLPMQ